MPPVLRRLALLLEYDGRKFCGFQRQPGLRTVQQTVETALRQLSGDENLTVVGSSRTDQGVHARGLVCHLDAALPIPPERLPLALNSLLPEDVALLAAREVAPTFHARHDAVGKIYSYRFYVSRTRPVTARHTAAHVPQPVDLEAMRQAADALCGTHDFLALMDQNNNPRPCTVRTIESITLEQTGTLLTMTVCGSGFLYHMVRILAGTLLAAGQGKIQPAEIESLLKSGNRRLAGKTMPPQGLCLEAVRYPEPLFGPSDLLTKGG
jgi:tRNA pseudouridine38-40 synthase